MLSMFLDILLSCLPMSGLIFLMGGEKKGRVDRMSYQL